MNAICGRHVSPPPRPRVDYSEPGRESLLVFVRYPEPGKAKTRLISEMGSVGAAEIYRYLAEQVMDTVVAIERPGMTTTVWGDPGSRIAALRRWLGPGPDYMAQPEGDLGQRLGQAFAEAFAGGAQRVIAIGSDCIELSGELITVAFDHLLSYDAVLGPAADGGYYLVGLARPLPAVFEGIPWSSDETLAVTRERLVDAGFCFFCLPPLRDIDTWQDVQAAGLTRRPGGEEWQS